MSYDRDDGTKVTTDPERFNDPVQEGPGFVASDSLAAESMNRSGDFASNDSHAGISGQAAHGSTASNEDTSGATRLDPTGSASERPDNYGDDTDLNRGSGRGKDEGVGPTYNRGSGGDESRGYGDSSRSDDNYGTSGSGADTYGGGDDANAGSAPSYVGGNELAREQQGRPKGENLSEGGFDSDAKNASFDSKIGSKDDPGRLAEQKFQRENAQGAFDAGSGPRQGEITDDGQYESLRRDEEA